MYHAILSQDTPKTYISKSLERNRRGHPSGQCNLSTCTSIGDLSTLSTAATQISFILNLAIDSAICVRVMLAATTLNWP